MDARRPDRAWVMPATADDPGYLAPRLREADRREVRAAFGRPAEAILEAGFRNAKRCWTVSAGGLPIAMFGVGRRREPRIGTVWLLSSPGLDRFRGQLRREGPYWVDVLMVGHDVLTNFVAAENRVAVRWLTWLGFELLTLHRGAGTGGEDFWEFAAFRPGTRARYLPDRERNEGAASERPAHAAPPCAGAAEREAAETAAYTPASPRTGAASDAGRATRPGAGT